jgi:hypothetical protein
MFRDAVEESEIKMRVLDLNELMVESCLPPEGEVSR